MRDLATESQVAILWATHLVDEVEGADRVILLKQGEIKADSTPDGLREQAGMSDLTEAYGVLAGQ